MSERRSIALAALAGDLLVVLAAYLGALFVRFDVLASRPSLDLVRPDWSLAVVALATVGAFHIWGLYKREAFALRTLHVFTLTKATLAAFITSALIVYLLKSPVVMQSRFVIAFTFLLIFAATLVWRLAILTPRYFAFLARRQPQTLVIGASLESEALVARLEELRGYSAVHVVAPLSPEDVEGLAACAVVDALGRDERPVDNIFIDTASLAPRVTLELVERAKGLHAEVYVLSRILSPLDSTRLLTELFDQPVMRVRLHPHERRARLSKRVFDVTLAGGALLVLSPLLLAIAAAIKLTSKGPVFYVNERVGLKGRTFRFLKFRSMQVNSDHEAHRDFVCRLIDGEVVCEPGDEGFTEDDAFYKIADDPRVTRVGALLRTYSLDELPQFWHVVTGEMSLVGPRPALPYEVERYKEWHRERLNAVPGVSGLWQVAGRSRVGFDDMVLEDVMYTYNQGLMTDLGICLRTVPVVLFGRGAA